jgi:hypothetical protein
MKLPNLDSLVVEQQKIEDYLLSKDNLTGRDKEVFFRIFGFERLDWKALADALREQARNHDIVTVRDTSHGRQYVVEGRLNTPSGRQPRVRAVWIVELGVNSPRLVTAYPL